MPHAPDWSTLNDALGRALEREGPAREAFLSGLDGPLRAAVAPLLRAALAEDPVLDHPATVLDALAAPAADAPVVEAGGAIGLYRVVEPIGEGGMGRVYRARRADDASGRTVAVKVVRGRGVLTGSDGAGRMRREQALLAALDHPGIARFLDAGETAAGDPYLVMEDVAGEPITDWADARRLDAEARVGLVAAVARAVGHAHERHVLHRDLKPANVLVAERDGEPAPVVLDFGIGKLLAEGPDAPPPLTRTGQRLLTPAYGAPEQSRPKAPVTPATDVFSLGVLLYELLTGALPYRDGAQHAPDPPEPAPPLVVLGARVTGRTEAVFAGVNAACLRALRPAPGRRYASAGAFADALGRALDAKPLEGPTGLFGSLRRRLGRRG